MQQNTINYWDLIDEIDQELECIGWSVNRAKAYIKHRYGKSSRHKLTDEQILEFWDFLKSV